MNSYFPGRFGNRNIIVTGGASGIGLEVCKRIAKEGGCVEIWDLDRNQVDLAVHSIGESGRGRIVDVTSPDAVAAAARQAAHDMHKIDGLVCSAGIAGENLPVTEYPAEEWLRVIDINLNGVFYCNRFVSAEMRKNSYGRIVNIASIAGKEGNPRSSAYSASKAGVIGFTKSLAKELARDGIVANTIAPATVETPMLATVPAAHMEYMLSKIPMNRLGTVGEVASMVTWLLSEECSFSTGAVFDLSGGRATY